VSRRRFFASSAAAVGIGLGDRLEAPAVAFARDTPGPLPAAIAALEPRTDGVTPISLDERRARLARGQRLLAEFGLDAVVMASGSSLEYFTGARWGLSERFFGAVLTREGDPAWVTPAFEQRRAREQIRIGDEVRAWEEHESPYALVKSLLADRKVVSGRIGLEETMPFAFADGIAKALPAARVESATPVTAGCRVIKDAHEIALMKRACEITLRAHRAVFQSLRAGMAQGEAAEWSAAAHRRLGIEGGSLVLFGADAAFPHGTTEPKPLRAGDAVIVDGGGRLHGYTSDITRTLVFGAPPTERQRTIWQTVRRAQEAAFQAARPGVRCEEVDRAARAVIEAAGFGKGYEQFTHRLGHGIGMDGHEWTYFVRGNDTRLRPGMCFSNEPGIYIPGEIGVRHEDVIVITETGAESLTPWSGTPEDPAVL
jgi:Xaa-Pro dipeptidase